MRRALKNAGPSVLVTLLAACSALNTGSLASRPPQGVEHRGSAVILHGAGLQGRGNLVDLLASRISSLRVQWRPCPACPVLSLRGSRTILGDPNPLV